MRTVAQNEGRRNGCAEGNKMRIRCLENGSRWSWRAMWCLLACFCLCGLAHAATGDITITSPSPDPANGASFTSVVNIDVGSGDIAGYVFHIEYSPTVIHVTDIRGASTPPFNTTPGTNLSVVGGDSGDVTFSSDIDPSNPPSGVVELARIDFDVVGAPGSSSNLTITVASIADSMGQPFAANPIAGNATVATQTYDLTDSVLGGHGSVSPTSGTYDAGTVVTLTATPDPGYTVKAWAGTDNDASTATTNAVTMDSDKSVTVEFKEVPIGP